MARQRHHAHNRRAHRHIGDGRIVARAFALLFADNQFDDGEQRRQPRHRRHEHGEDHAHDQETAEHVGDAGKERRSLAQTQHAAQGVHRPARQRHLQRGEPAVGGVQRQEVEEDVQGIEGARLSRREEGDAAENLRVPEGDLARRQRAANVQLPGRVLQHQVGRQPVVGDKVGLQAAPRLEGVECVPRQQAAPGERREEYGQEPQQSQRQDQSKREQVTAVVAEACHRGLEEPTSTQRRKDAKVRKEKQQQGLPFLLLLFFAYLCVFASLRRGSVFAPLRRGCSVSGGDLRCRQPHRKGAALAWR